MPGVVTGGYDSPGGGGGGGGAPTDAQYIVGAANATLTQERVATDGQRVDVTIGAATATWEATTSRSYILLEDEFISGTGSNGTNGILGWTLPAGTLTGVTATAAHPGVQTLSSTTSAGTIGRLYLATIAAAASWVPGDLAYMAFLVNPRLGTTVMSARFGILATAAGSGEASQGIYWSFLPGTSANWRTVTRDGGGITSNTTATAYALSTWYFLEIIRATNGTDWEFWLNGVLQFTHSATIPTGAGFPGFYIETNEAAAKTVDCDYFALRSINPLGARF